MAVSETIKKPRRRLPPFLDHFNVREFKTFFRCWVAVWVACILMFIQPVLSNFGADVFFACVVLFIVPPSGVLFVYILGVVTLFVGICLAWAWGVITLKAALAARSAAEMQALLASLQQAVGIEAQATGESGSRISQRIIFDGWMLDTRVTVVIYCMLCPFIYFMARLRAANPKATLGFLFSIIITDSFLCFGPVLPSFDGTLPLPLVKPAAVGVGIGLACTILFFPQSTVGIILEGINDVVEDLKAPLQFLFTASSMALGKADAEYLGKCQAKVIGGYQKLEPSFAFLPLDFSIGCWGADVVKAFQDPIRQLVMAILALSDFHCSGIKGDIQINELRGRLIDSSDEALDMKKFDKKKSREVGAHQRAQLAELVNALYKEDHSILEELATKLRGTSLTAIEGCLEGLTVIQESLQFVGRQHWYRKASPAEHDQAHERIQTVFGSLRETHTKFLHDMAEGLEEAYGPVLDDFAAQKHQPGNFSGIIIYMNFQEHMVNTLTRTEMLLEQVSNHFSAALRTRLWWPTRIKYAVSWALKRHTKAPTMTAGATPDNPGKLERNEATKAANNKRSPLLGARRGYRPRARHPVGKAILGLYNWIACDEGLYALRIVVVTIAVSIPAVLPSTAGFFYREKGLWALVTSQLGLAVYMADFTFSTFSPAAGTLGGGLLGLLGWYIGSGGGPGNPYGLSAVCAVFLIILLWIRLYIPQNHIPGGTLAAATFLLVIVYSYVDTHNPTYGDPGVGYNVFWRRLLLILIGSGAATIVQIFPYPPSAAHHVCKSLSRSARNLSDYYALLLSSWTQTKADRRALVEPIWMEITQALHILIDPISNLRFEFSSSRFDSATLEQIRQIHHIINNNLARLLVASAALPREYRDQLTQMTGMLDHRCIGEVMAVLGICEQALWTGDSPPEILPTPLVRRALEYGRSHQTGYSLSAEMIKDKDYHQYCVALAAYVRFLGRIDDLVLVIKGALGEAHLVADDLADQV
ncbi:hypothetical protein BJX63DRAFT_440324 [Aspergillus granulosus]|uniref:ER transporter 6TM N-terminal domain-containing protein n=1 Tax=Aspergillus granulosus TaxID=176169 RepID=A0ABR4HRC0_9EURO